MSKYLVKAGIKLQTFQLFILVLFLISSTSGQQISNLQIFDNLTDSLSNKIIRALPNNVKTLELSSANQDVLSVLVDFLRKNLIKSGLKLNSDSGYDEKLNLTIVEAKVEYNDLFKDRLFGNYFMTRTVNLSGSFVLSRRNEVYDFNFSSVDTVEYENYEKLESKLYPITEGSPPSEPFFSSLFEPVIAIAATATAVILFFTIRSK